MIRIHRALWSSSPLHCNDWAQITKNVLRQRQDDKKYDFLPRLVTNIDRNNYNYQCLKYYST